MKKYLLAAALVLASTSALADEVSGNGQGQTRADACESAKISARARTQGAPVEQYSACQCDKDESKQYPWWACSVNARVKEH